MRFFSRLRTNVQTAGPAEQLNYLLQTAWSYAVDFIITPFGGIVRFLSKLSWTVCANYSTKSGSHVGVSLDSAEFENAFKDSGYWDYCILSSYDAYFRLYGVYSLFVVTDFSIVEKASWKGVGSVL